jgi:hypothetical protein
MRRPSRLSLVLSAGVVDSVGLAFGWTVFLLAVTERDGLDAATAQSAAALAGVAVSAPVSARLAAWLAPRDLLRVLAVAEGLCRVGLFGLFWADVPSGVMALLVGVMNVLAWSAFAAMRTEVSRARDGVDDGATGSAADGGAGRLLTMYAVAILSSEALATGLASLVLDAAPSGPLLAAVAVSYGLTLVPQWIVGVYAPRSRPHAGAGRTPWRLVAVPCGAGGLVFLLAAAPALAATVLAYEAYGRPGVVVSAVAFAAGSFAAARVQAVVGRRPSTVAASCALGAVLVGGWSLAGLGLAGLAVAQACAGVAQCALEGDLDARIVARAGAARSTSALALASSSRALGGALAVWALPYVVGHVPLHPLCGVVAAVLALAGLAAGLLGRRRAASAVPAPAVPVARRPLPVESLELPVNRRLSAWSGTDDVAQPETAAPPGAASRRGEHHA